MEYCCRFLRACALLALLAQPACGDDDDGAGAGSAGSAAGNQDAGTSPGPVVRDPLDAGAADASALPTVHCDVDPPRTCEDPMIAFADVEPIIKDRCLSCHDGTTEQWPLLTYSHVASWFSQIRDAMLHCTMPPADSGVAMPTEEREQLLQWIKCGFPQ